MLRPRIIPTLLIKSGSLVKTVGFNRYDYIGDPVNTAKIFNELEVDEIVIQDVSRDRHTRGIDFDLIEDLASECFMPLAYGGGVKSVSDAERLIRIGVEKVIINSSALENADLINQIASKFGSQAVVVSIDVKKNFMGKYRIFSHSGSKRSNHDLSKWLGTIERRGCGEVLVTSISHEGSWAGYDMDLLGQCVKACNLPVIINGGASSLEDIKLAFSCGASAAGVGSLIVYQKKGMGVLVNFPTPEEISGIV